MHKEIFEEIDALRRCPHISECFVGHSTYVWPGGGDPDSGIYTVAVVVCFYDLLRETHTHVYVWPTLFGEEGA